MAKEDKVKPEDGDETGKKSDDPAAEEKKFTQAEVDAIIEERLRRVNAKFEDYDELRAKAKKLDDLEGEQLSEIQKLQKDIEDLRKSAEQSERQRLATERKNLIITEATKLNFADPVDAIALIGDAEDIPAALSKLAEEKSYLLKNEQKLQKPKIPVTNPKDPKSAGSEETRDQKRSRLFGMGGAEAVFDPNAASQSGGGVQWTPGALDEIQKSVASDSDE